MGTSSLAAAITGHYPISSLTCTAFGTSYGLRVQHPCLMYVCACVCLCAQQHSAGHLASQTAMVQTVEVPPAQQQCHYWHPAQVGTSRPQGPHVMGRGLSAPAEVVPGGHPVGIVAHVPGMATPPPPPTPTSSLSIVRAHSQSLKLFVVAGPALW